MRRPKRHQSKRALLMQHQILRERHRWMDQEYCRRREELVALYKKVQLISSELRERQKQFEMAQKIVDRAAMIDFERCENGYYQISLTFNGDFMGGISRHGEVQRHVARRVAEQIEHEIASSKFVESARQNYRQQMEREVRMRSAIGPPGWNEGRGDGH